MPNGHIMAQPIVQIGIIGGGPAGSATALALKKELTLSNKRVNIILICAPQATAPSIGETIPPAASFYLRELDAEHILNSNKHLVCPGSKSRWADEVTGYNDFFISPVGKGFHLDRKHFDADLIALCKTRGITVFENTKVSTIDSSKKGYLLHCDNHTTSIACDFLIDATGQHQVAAKSLNISNNVFDSMISACAFFELEHTSASTTHTLVASDPNGWWYGAILPNNRAIISLCTDATELKTQKLTCYENWLNCLKANNWFFQQCTTFLQDKTKTPVKLYAKAAPSAILSNVIGHNWLAVGDAASSYDSISSAGITKSLKHADVAAKAVKKWLEAPQKDSLDDYQSLVFNDFNAFISLHQQHYQQGANKYPNAKFWQRRLLLN